MKPADCLIYLQQLAEHDGFLNAVDQHPELGKRLDALRSAIDLALDQGREELQTADENLAEELAEVAAHLAGSAELLAAAFEEARKSVPLQSDALQRLARTIEARILWLYDRVRARQERSLNQARPRNRFRGNVVQKVAEALTQGIRDLPEELTLIRDRVQQSDLQGRSIWQVEGDALRQALCTGRTRPGLRIAFARRRLRLRRRYQILQPVLREAFERHRPPLLHPDQKALYEDYARRFEEISRTCSDLWRGLRFNLETAAEDCTRLATEAAAEEPEHAELRRKLDETGRLVAETLARSEQQLATVAAPIAELSLQMLEELGRECREMTDLVPRDLNRILSRQERLAYHRRRLARLWQKKYRTARSRLQGPLEASKRTWAWVQQHVIRLSPIPTQNAGGGEATLRSITDLPTIEAIQRKAEHLPPVCRRLFTRGALKNREFLVGRSKELETLKELFQRWQEGLLCSAAMIGPDGSGKTSLANCFQSELGNQAPVLRLCLTRRLTDENQLLETCREWFGLEERPADLAAMEAHLASLPPSVVIVEELHQLLLRSVGGMRAARAFLRLVLASRHRLLWIVTVRKHPWQRMCHLLNIERYFTHKLHTQFNNLAEMRDALLLRLHTSSYPVTYLNGRGETQSAQKDDQASRQERFFTDLFAATRGNMQAALYYWLLHLDYDAQQQTLQVSALGRLDYNPLRALDRGQLYALAELVAHGGLSVAEHTAIFGEGELQSRMLLDHLAQLNLLCFPADEALAGSYQINPLFFAPLTSLLESRNIIQ